MIKTLLIIAFISLILTIAIFKISDYLYDKPKTKFRQWWSRNLVDLDNNYND